MGVLEVRDAGDVQPGRRRKSVPSRPVSIDHAPHPPGEPAPVQRRCGDDREPTLRLEGEERREERHPAHVAMRPVDGVDDPAPPARPCRIAQLLAVLLAHEPVLGEPRRDAGPDRPLDRHIGGRHERGIRLGLDLDAPAERSGAMASASSEHAIASSKAAPSSVLGSGARNGSSISMLRASAAM